MVFIVAGHVVSFVLPIKGEWRHESADMLDVFRYCHHYGHVTETPSVFTKHFNPSMYIKLRILAQVCDNATIIKESCIANESVQPGRKGERYM